jgi:hypothetical protein
MKDYNERPFEYLKGKNDRKFSSETVKNWYKARAFVLDKLKDVAFKVDDNNHLHVVLASDSDLMLAVARQAALSAHYINYDEENGKEEKRRRTVITLVSKKESKIILPLLSSEEYLYNLLDHCKYTIDGKSVHKGSYIDVEFVIVKDLPEIDENNRNEVLIKEDDVASFCNSKLEDEIYSIDTRKAVFASRMYDLGTLIENLPAENIHDAHRYALALDVYQFQKLQEPPGKLINESKWEKKQIDVKNGLSNVFCADCFETREREIAKTKDAAIEACQTEEKKEIVRKENFWEKYNEALCRSEHARWVVEKLLMGFRPLNNEERIEDERLSPYKDKRKEYRNSLKKNIEILSHIDLCSYSDLRRVDPDNMKYDSFLMLAIPKILEQIQKDDKL